MSVYELAKRYYPRLWNKARIDALVEAGKLSKKEAENIVKGADDDRAGA